MANLGHQRPINGPTAFRRTSAPLLRDGSEPGLRSGHLHSAATGGTGCLGALTGAADAVTPASDPSPRIIIASLFATTDCTVVTAATTEIPDQHCHAVRFDHATLLIAIQKNRRRSGGATSTSRHQQHRRREGQ